LFVLQKEKEKGGHIGILKSMYVWKLMPYF